MSFEPVLATMNAFVGVPRLGVDGGDHPVGGHLLGDAPASVGAIGALDRFDVLAGDQRQQCHRVGRFGAHFLLGQMPKQPVGVTDQGVDQLIPGLLIVPGDRGFTRVVVVVGMALCRDHLAGTGHLAAHPPDRPDQLDHRVLGGHRVVEHRGIQRPPRLTSQHPGRR